LSRYYGFTINQIADMSLYQFNSYMSDIPEIEKIFSGGQSKQKDITTTEDLMKMAKKRGIKTPKKF